MKLTQQVKWVFIALWVLLIAACGDNPNSGFPKPICGEVDNPCVEITAYSITPSKKIILAGSSLQYSATASFSDGTVIDVTKETTWSVDVSSVASISNEETEVGLAQGISVGQTFITAKYRNVSATGLLRVADSPIDRMEVIPVSADLPVGVTNQYEAFVLLQNGQVINISHLVAWQIENEVIASVDEQGLVSALSVGMSKVDASLNFKNLALSDSAEVNVIASVIKEIVVTPSDEKFPLGSTGYYKATAYYSDGQVLDVSGISTWSVTDGNIASIVASGDSAGYANAIAVGSTVISATFEGTKGETSVEITSAELQEITLSPVNATTPAGTQVIYSAYGLYSDGSKREITQLAVWSSSEPTIANIESSGELAGIAQTYVAGNTKISVHYSDITASTTLTVTNAIINQLQITPQHPSVPLGFSGQFIATAYYSDNTTSDVTHDANWHVDDDTIAAIYPEGSQAGYAKALSIGTTNVSASFSGITAIANLTVTNAILTSLQLTPSSANIAIGTTQRYQLFGLFNDGSSKDLTLDANWQSSDTHLAVVTHKGVAIALRAGTLDISATYEGNTQLATLTVTAATLTSIQLTPGSTSLAVGHQEKFTAIAKYSDFSHQDITELSTWKIVDSAVAQVANGDNAGLVTALSIGNTQVSVEFQGATAQSGVEVTNAVLESVSISPVAARVPVGIERQYHLMALFSDGTSVDVSSSANWQSSQLAIATIDAQGIATGVTQGHATIQGSYKGVMSAGALEVIPGGGAPITFIQVTPAVANVPVGTENQFVATAYYSGGDGVDITTQATWVSDNNSVVSVITSGSEGGFGTALSVGSAKVSASWSGHTSNIANVTVTAATLVSISIDPVLKEVGLGLHVQYIGYGIYSDGTHHDLPSSTFWNSTDQQVATVQPSGTSMAEATTLHEGVTKISARVDNIESNKATLTVTEATVTSLQVTPAIASVPVGTQNQFVATAYFSDNTNADVTTQATWVSDDSGVVSVVMSGNEGGNAHALTVGTANVSATYIGISSNNAVITVAEKVIDSVQITPNSVVTPNGSIVEYKVIANYKDYSFKDVTQDSTMKSLDTAIMTFEDGNFAHTHSVGDVEISANYQGITSEKEFLHVTSAVLESIQVTPASVEMAQGIAGHFAAVGYYSDGTNKDITQQVTWVSDNSNVVSVIASGEEGGNSHALAVGTAKISASMSQITSNMAVVTVIAKTLTSIEIVVEDDATLPKGTVKHYQAFATYSDDSVEDITRQAHWQSERFSIVTVVKGVIAGVNVGASNITIHFEDQASSQLVTVTNAIATSLAVTPSYHEMNVGSRVVYRAIATMSDGSTENVTKDVTYETSDSSITSIVRNEVRSIIVEGIAPGDAIFTVTFDNKVAIANLSVLSLTLSSISITPLDETISVQSTLQYQAMAHYSDGTDVIITDEVNWRSDNTGVATINNSEYHGLAAGVSTGSAIVSAQFESESASTSLTVGGECGPGKPQRVFIIPNKATLSINTEMQFKLYGVWSDGCESQLTKNNANNWSSADSKIVSINQKSGIALGKKLGTTTITADYQHLTANPVNVQVIDEEVLSVSIQPAPSSVIAVNGSQNYVCSARTSVNGVEQPEKFVTALANFTSSNESIALIGNNDGSNQTVNATSSKGTSTITCYYGSKSASTSLIVN